MRKVAIRVRRAFVTPFGSAFLGGLVVAALGIIAIGAGWIDSDEGGNATAALAPAPIAPSTASVQSSNGNTINQIYQHDAAGVAFVQATTPAAPPSPFNPFGGGGGGVATGSGFVIDDQGHILTNAHVVDGASKIEVTLGNSDSAQPVHADVVGKDESTDVALLKVDVPSDQLHPLPLGNSSQLKVGDPVVAIGNPFGLDRTATAGIVSALQREIKAPDGFTISNVIQTDAPINPGNSGGPLIDSSGRVIGINSQIEAPGGGGNVGIGFAVPINTARDVAKQLISGGQVQHAFLGITGTDVTPQVANVLNLSVDKGALVQSVTPDSPAAKAGLEGGKATVTIDGQRLQAGGDVITAVDGKSVSGMDDVATAVDSKQPGDEIQLSLAHGDQTRTVTVTLADRPQSTPQG